MRKGYSLLILLLCCTWVSAQNWAPINTTDKFNYKFDTASAISHTLWVDSVQVVGGDTVYWMNRIVKPISDTIALKNQPQFLQKQVHIKSTGVYSFDLPNHIVYNPSVALGDSMLYDTTANITAKVVAIGTANILGNTDSTKTFLLSSGDTVVVSKNYGFVQYPDGYINRKYYRLAGIEGGRNIGEHVARFHDFFDFQVGDVFEYYQHTANWFLAIARCQIDEYVTTRMTVVRKQVASNTISYFMKTNYRDEAHNDCNYYYGVADTGSLVLQLVDSVNSEINLYPNQAMLVTNDNPHTSYFDFSGAYYHLLAPFQLNYSGCDWSSISFSSFFIVPSFLKNSHGNTAKVFDTYYGLLNADTLIFGKSPDYYGNYRTFTEGIGIDSYKAWCNVAFGDGGLLAYHTANDSMGILDTFPRTGIEIIESNAIAFSFHPNPVTTKLNIQLPEATNATIRLLDINGSEILVQQMQDSHTTISTSSLPAGMYIVEVYTKDGVGRKKVIKL